MTTVWSSTTQAKDVAAELKDVISGKTVLVTGPTPGGLGFEAAHTISQYAKTMILVGRSLAKLQKAEDKIVADFKTVKVHKITADLTSFESVSKAAAEINALGEPIHVVIANAVISPKGYTPSSSGTYEVQFQGDHLSHFLLIKSIFPSILKARTESFAPRIVSISSMAHQWGPLNLDNLTFDGGKAYSTMLGYGAAKTANLLFVKEFAEKAKAKDTGVLAFAIHPGTIWTNGFDSIPEDDKKAFGITNPDGTVSETFKSTMKTLNQGAAGYVIAAFDPRLKDQSGSYLYEDNVISNDKIADFASSDANAKRLWEMSEKFVGTTFEL